MTLARASWYLQFWLQGFTFSFCTMGIGSVNSILINCLSFYFLRVFISYVDLLLPCFNRGPGFVFPIWGLYNLCLFLISGFPSWILGLMIAAQHLIIFLLGSLYISLLFTTQQQLVVC